MKKSILVFMLIILAISAQNLNAKKNEEVKVILTFKTKLETKKNFMIFLRKNIPNVRSFEGCTKVNLYFNDTNNEMTITENWKSKKHHEKYIKFISDNGVMKTLISFLQKEPSIKYYSIINI